MKTTLRRLTWGSARLWLVALVAIAVTLAATRDSTQTSAVNPEILPSLSATSPMYSSSAVLVKGGHVTAGNTPCSPGDTDPTTLCLRIWAKGVNNTTGVSAHQIHYVHPSDKLQVSAANGSTTWLSSTSRPAVCPVGNFQIGEGTFECNTFNLPPPWGATGDGVMGTIAIVSMENTGLATFTLATGTMLVDTPPNPDDAVAIPATVRSISIFVAPCADFNGSGNVSVADILYVVQRYQTSDPLADLDGSGTVTVADIILAVKEFSMVCTP